MKAKKIILLCAALSTAAFMSTGCQNSARTDEEIVIPKEEDAQEKGKQEEGAQGSEGISGMEETKNAAGEAIADQVQAPEYFSWEGGNEQISVKVSADVVIPEGEGFQSYKVTSRPFTQEDYDSVSQVLINGEKLWERDQEVMGASNGWTADEINERIALLEEEKVVAMESGKSPMAEEYGKGKTYDEMIKEWNILKQQAPDEVSLVEVPAIVTYHENSENPEENYFMGTATVEGEDYFVCLDNNLRDDWIYTNFSIRNEKNRGNFSFLSDSDDILDAGISVEEIRQNAQEKIAAMGFTDFAVTGGEYLSAVSINEKDGGEAEVEAVGYSVYFTRLLDGIPVTYTHETGGSLEGSEDVPWNYEELKMVYTKDGFAEFSWSNPYEVEKTSEEYVFLLPFSEIQNVFEEMMVKKYGDFFAKTGAKVEFEINEVRLGYMRVMERGNTEEAKMIPVWDFFGSETIDYPDMEEPYTLDWPYESWLTINAMDGTIIDRGFGY